MNQSIDRISHRILDLLGSNKSTFYLYGSVVLDDFRLGWSDIDFLCLTENPVDDTVANQLLYLRQTMLAEEPENPWYRSFEGAFVWAEEFLREKACRAVYWGTSGQRLMDSYSLDCFSRKEILASGLLLWGDDLRERMPSPTHAELYAGILHHCRTIRTYAVEVSRTFYSYGWMLDIARCLYTIRTGEIISKTAAGEWALEHSLCPVPETLRSTLILRQNPLKYRDDPAFLDYTAGLGADIQRFADVLEVELNVYERRTDECPPMQLPT